MPRQDVTAVVNTAVMLTVAAAAALSLCVAGILNNERDCGVVVTSCERTQGCSRAVVWKVRGSDQTPGSLGVKLFKALMETE